VAAVVEAEVGRQVPVLAQQRCLIFVIIAVVGQKPVVLN